MAMTEYCNGDNGGGSSLLVLAGSGGIVCKAFKNSSKTKSWSAFYYRHAPTILNSVSDTILLCASADHSSPTPPLEHHCSTNTRLPGCFYSEGSCLMYLCLLDESIKIAYSRPALSNKVALATCDYLHLNK